MTPKHITIVPASTKAGREAIRALLKSNTNTKIRGIYRDTTKAPADFSSDVNFEAVKGDVATGAGLDFSSSDAVFYIPPATYYGQDQGEWARQSSGNVKTALEKAPSVQRLLILSALGSQNDRDIGVLRINHIADELLKHSVPDVIIVRPGFFFEDWAPLIETAKEDPPYITSWVAPADHHIPMLSIKDVGETCADKLLHGSGGKPSPYYYKHFGPRLYSTNDIQKAVEGASGKKVQVRLVEKKDLGEYFGQHLPEVYVPEFVEMTLSGLPGGITTKDFNYDEDTVKGKVEFEDVVKEWLQG
ncbi:hypothetical protein S7711_02297 [Stachybotrys chartarum IBT 7711]|uniref:NAD(P)-binding domain-containing protein n=1 Tax=Stachybotrys chartarum (strain CBS 109288 / IBT 7711) TaxID=1280523 RepID=A0A084B0V6_STACB|nr:hypothetical protein S7711_02297 [Stachybotrys chartarum IBT 7711]KFA71163.1 hypothetical protein S40288_04675 [Stachybotrys chartarum IBT 40288]